MKKNFLYRYILVRLIPFLSRHPGILIVGALIYLISPLDLLPEAFTGLVGYLDDILAIVFVGLLAKKLKDFRNNNLPTSESKKPINPYKVLDLKPGATKVDIIKAYRKKMAEYHPDKVAHLGDDIKKTAHQKTLEIQNAYNILMKK